MAALTKERETRRLSISAFPGADPIPFKQKGSTKVFKGALVALNAGFAAPGTAATSLVAVGVASETSDNSSGSDGAVSVLVEEGIFEFNNHGTNTVVQANVGSDCFIEDDNTVGNVSTGKSRAGKVVGFSGTKVLVKVALGA